jgi:fructokinase
MLKEYIGAIEGGGTKFDCAVLDANHDIISSKRIATTTPDETINHVIAFFQAQKLDGLQFEKLGLACFGPLDLHPSSPHYGSITATPKAGWSNTPIMAMLQDALHCAVSIDTDVNGAALAEATVGLHQNTQSLVYLTIGTGFGGGLVVNGQPVHGLIHPEMGHMKIQAPEGLKGICPFHNNCVEGLVSGTAIRKIWGQGAESLPEHHQAWGVITDIIAQCCHNLIMTISPQKIILGGGVMQRPGVLEKIQRRLELHLANYLTLPQGLSVEDLISLPTLDGKQGIIGAALLTKL